MVLLFVILFAEGFVGDIAVSPNVRYELEYELQSRRDREKKLAAKTSQVLIDWEIDGDQAEAEKEADRPAALLNDSSALRLHHSTHLQANDGQQQQQDRPGGRQGKKQASITE